MACGSTYKRRIIPWSPPLHGVIKFNVDGAARGTPSHAGIGRVLRNDKGEVLCMFSKGLFVYKVMAQFIN